MAMNTASNIAQRTMGPVPTVTTNDPNTRSSGETMKALAWYGKNDLRLIDAPIPTITDAQDAIIRVTGSTVCGSDLHLLHGNILQLEKGDILGHEAIGIVEEVGSGVTGVKKGERVVVAFSIGCGTCTYCRKELFTMCEGTNESKVMEKMYGKRLAGIQGYGHFGGGFAGCQAEYVRVPFANTNLLPLPATIPDSQALYLSDIICTAYHACVQSGAQPGETVGIWGLGPIGLCVAQWLRNVFGVKRIIGIDNIPTRLKMAQDLFGVEPLDFNKHTDVVARIKEVCPEGLDRTIDCAAFRYAKSWVHKLQLMSGLETDTSEILNEQIRAVKKFGTVALIADYAATTNGLLIGAVMEMGIRLIGCGQAPVQKYWKTCLDYMMKGTFDVKCIVTHKLPLEKVVQVYDRFDKKEEGMMKVFLTTRFSGEGVQGGWQAVKEE
ncbi:hypothetical protein HDU85_002417 [Gaertneriomyces sp. JEL0708]|nr:hypothetical protein HDU85_002417 [Gaertneriomyces sp. JEL0708]